MHKLIFFLVLNFFGVFVEGQIRVGIEFGEPTQDCNGRGQLCQIESLKETSNPEGEGILQIKDGRLCLTLTNQTCAIFLPDNYCDLPKGFQVSESLNKSLGVKSSLLIDAGRYSTMECDSVMQVCF